MSKIFKLFEQHFAYLSVSIILSVIIVLFINNTNIIAMISIFTLIALYSSLFIRYNNLTKNANEQQELALIAKQNYEENSGHYVTVDSKFNITYFSQQFLREYELTNKSLLGRNFFEILHMHSKEIIKQIDENGNFKGIIETFINQKKRYQSLIIESSIKSPYKEYFIVCHDVTDSFKSVRELKEQFFVDRFTGLPTKVMLLDDIELSTNKSILNVSSLIYINIDSFDEINEFLGIDAGNTILSYVANWLANELPTKESKLYKLDLSSFAIFTTQRLTLTALDNYLKKISKDIENENFFFKDTALNITFTLGAGRCKKDIVKCTYLALKDAQNLKKSYKIYDKNCQHEDRFIKNIKVTQIIKDAILENRIVPFFQPIYNLQTNKVEKFETLIRIQNRNQSYLKPSEFLDVAKKSKLYLELSKSMIHSSFEKLETFKFPITINISVADILDKKVSNFILRKLNSSGHGELITFEIVENQEIESHVRVVNFLRKVKLHGCKIAIDDFGSGYSNFEQLLKLDIDFLKIDGSLIRDIVTNKESEIMTKSIISFAKELGIQTIAEFVSSEVIFDKVKLLGVDYVQGYHIGKPSSMYGQYS